MEQYTFRTFDYVVKYPTTPAEKNPTLLLLHGAGTRGRDISLLKSSVALQEDSCFGDKDSPLLIFAPQCHKDTWFDLFEELEDFVRMIANHPAVDPQRLYVAGASMGGYTTWQLAMSLPEYFAAALPICGGGMYWNAARLKDVPIWAVHGALDTTVLPEESLHMVNAVNRNGGTARLTLLESADHNSWTYTYHSREILQWLLAQKKTTPVPTAGDPRYSGANFG